MKYIIGNWKMKITDIATAKKVFNAEKKIAGQYRGVQVIVCVPFMYLEPLSKLVTGHRCVLGAQDVFYEEKGAFTGEIPPKMLQDRKVRYCIVGHSERRAMGETDEIVAKKVQACLKNSITPILCVGELERKDARTYYQFVQDQLLNSLAGVAKKSLGSIIFAYEPVWALSSTKGRHDATPGDAREMSLFIKKVLSDMYKMKKTDNLTIVYGGSANRDNARAFLEHGGVDGLLPGSASVDPMDFGQMIQIAARVSTSGADTNKH